MMSREQLEQLRVSIIEKITPLLDGENLAPEDRFSLIIRLAQTQGSYELYEKAYKIADRIESEDGRLNAYMRLLDDVESELDVEITQQGNETEASAQETQQEVSSDVPQSAPEGSADESQQPVADVPFDQNS